MRPAFSVLLLTTLIGTGQGLFLALVTVQLYALFALLPAQDGRTFYAPGSALALAFLVAGLAASFFHLGRPARAWRAAAQWRTSWLSREVIALPALAVLVAAYGAAHAAGRAPVLVTLPSGLAIDTTVAIGLAGTVAAFALFVCTGMIYACLRFVAQWATPLTVVRFVLEGGASGFTLAAAFATKAASALVPFLAGWALILTLLALGARLAAQWRNARLVPRSTLQTAIGIKHPQIVQKSPGFGGDAFALREFSHGRSAAALRRVQWLGAAAGFLVPIVAIAAVAWGAPPGLLLPAFVVQLAGLVAERWDFFAQARHPQNLYYGAAA